MKKRNQKSQIEEPINTGATPTIIAFTFQFERALFRLFSGHTNEMQIGLETLDDVAELIYRDNGIVEALLEQDAHTVQSAAQPFQDSSRKLWHTLRVWLSHLEDLQAGYPESRFLLVTNASVPANALARKLSDARSKEEVDAALKLLHQQAATIVANEKSEAKAEAEIVRQYDNETLRYLIKQLDLLDKGGTGSEVPPREATIQLFHVHSKIADKAQDIYRYLLGVMVDTCRKSWEKREAVWFVPQTFKDLLQEEMRRYSLLKYLERPMMSTGFKEYAASEKRNMLFLEQLSQLGLEPRVIDKHLDRYWAFYVERVRLEGEGITQADWGARDDMLHQRWEDCRDSAKSELKRLGKASTPEELGESTLYKTLDENYTAPLGEYPTSHPYFTHGHYHHLANNLEEPFFVYWHPMYGPKPKNDEGELS